MRIIAGSRKGARIFAPRGTDTRPTGDRVREAALTNDLVDVKVCAVDNVWSGLKLVRRKLK